MMSLAMNSNIANILLLIYLFTNTYNISRYVKMHQNENSIEQVLSRISPENDFTSLQFTVYFIDMFLNVCLKSFILKLFYCLHIQFLSLIYTYLLAANGRIPMWLKLSLFLF